MTKIYKESQSPLDGTLQFIGILFRLFGIYFVGLTIVTLVFRFITGADQQSLADILADSGTVQRKQELLILIQTLAPLIQFLLLPLIYIYAYQKRLAADVFTFRTWKPAIFFAMSLMLYFTFLPVLGFLIKWNQSWFIPENLHEMEKQAREITALLIQYDSRWDFLKVLFVVAVLPALGEELFFRGILQNEIRYLTGNIHVAIWTSAIIFSLAHFQFLGFIPRVCLGLMFGYAYVWSGNFWVPVGLHFINNAATLIMMSSYKDQYEKMSQGPADDISIPLVLFFACMSAVIVYFLYKLYEQRKNIYVE